MTRVSAVILAGGLRPSPLREALGVPEIGLPIGPGCRLLDAWRAALQAAGAGDVSIVVQDDEDVALVRALVARRRPGRSGGELHLEVLAEPASWRGTAGILRDVTASLPDAAPVLVAEASCLPPLTLVPLLEALAGDRTVAGVVGAAGDDEPAGVYAFRRAAIAMAPEVGYHDVKEQLLPALHERAMTVRTLTVCAQVSRVRDRASYLATVQRHLGDGAEHEPVEGWRLGGEPDAPQCVSLEASVSGSAVLDGCCLVGPGVVIEDGAVVHESVVLGGATVGGGAVVSRSVVGPGAVVPARGRVDRAVHAADRSQAPARSRTSQALASPMSSGPVSSNPVSSDPVSSG